MCSGSTRTTTAGAASNHHGLGFRKSFKLAPGLKLNLSRRSADVSVGPQGANVNANSRGDRASLSWRGASWRKGL
jgi:hypothetical protein